KGGGAGAFSVTDGPITEIAAIGERFESLRGALINNRGSVFLFATPRGGKLGIFRGSDRVFCVGDPMFGSTVTEFAQNPVSVNDADQLAVRVRLDDARQMIVRVS